MEWLNPNFLNYETAGGAVLLLLFVWLIARRKRRVAETTEDPKNRKIRQLDVDLRLTKQTLREVQEQLDIRQTEFDEAATTLQKLRTDLTARDAELEKLRANLQDEMRKTRELRQDLTDQAQERLREQAIRREAETQLEVVQAGSEAVIEEFSRMKEEKQSRLARKVTDTHVDISLDEMLSEE